MADKIACVDLLSHSDWVSALGDNCGIPYIETAIPFVVALVCVAIAVLFALSFLWMNFTSLRFSFGLRRLARKMSGIRSPDEPMDEARLREVKNLLGGNASAKHGWNEFSETLVHAGGNVLNTRPAREFFPEHEVVEARVHVTFFEAVPALLTGLGLFATFFALYLGLGELDVSDTGKIDGIKTFIEALSGKFLSSVIGLLSAVVFTLNRSLVLPLPYKAYRKFCEAFDSLFDRVTPELLLAKLGKRAEEQSATLKHLATDISDGFQQRMSENLTPPLERMIGLLETSLNERSETFERMASTLAETFRAQFSQSSDLEFGRVTEALESTVTMVSRMEQRSDASQQAFGDLIRSLSSATDQLSERLSSAAGSLGDTQSEARDAMAQLVGEILENSSNQSRESAQQVERAVEALRGQMSSVVTSLEQAASGLQQGGVESQQKLLAAAESLAAQVATGANEAAGSMAQVATNVIGQHSSQSGQLLQKMEEILERDRERAASQSQQVNEHRAAIGDFERLIHDSKATLEGLQLAAMGAKSASSVFHEAAGQVKEIQSESGRLLELGGRHSESMKAALEQSQQLLGQYERVLSTVDERLGRAVKTLGDELVRFQEAATSQLRIELKTFDEHLGSATTKLGSAVTDLGEQMEEAAETIAGSVAQTRASA